MEVRDASGASHASHAAPRELELVLRFGEPLPTLTAMPALLVPGLFSPSFARRLAAQRTPMALTTAALALDASQSSLRLDLRARAPLTPGQHYTLLWLHDDASTAFPLRVSASPWLGASFREGFPGDAEATAPPNLSRALVRFDGYVVDALVAHLRVVGGGTEDAHSERTACETLGLPAGDCLWVVPERPLAPRAAYELSVEAGLRSPSGVAPPAVRIAFTTRAEDDHAAPQLLSTRCASDELRVEPGLCLLADAEHVSVRGSVDEPVLASLAAPPQHLTALSYAGQFAIQRMPVATESHLLLRLVDMAGNSSELSFALAPRAAPPRISIEELRNDPLGREPAQEYVELLNSDNRVISLQGFSLTTDVFEQGRIVPGAVSLAPGERALVVGPTFDPRDTADGELPSAVRLAYLDRALSLPNTGGSLFLRDELGRRLSTAHFGAPLVAGQCSARLPAEPASVAGDVFALDPDGGCTPSSPTFDAP